MPVLKPISAALAGTNLTLQVQQNGQTASETFVNYAAGDLPSGGQVSITVDRTSLQCAPDSVRLGVDLSNAAFDTPGPAAGANYDPRLHDLVYLWDTGDTGTWSAPNQCLPEWNDKSLAKGPWIAHCYAQAGTYTVNLTVIEPSSGKMATDSVTITVGSADDVYAGTQTICVNAPGVSSSGWGPADAAYHTLSGVTPLLNLQPWWNGANNGTRRRILLDANQDYSALGIALLLGQASDPEDVMIAGHGGVVDLPDIPTGGPTSGRVVSCLPGWRGNGSNQIPDCRIANLRVTGKFNSQVEMRTDTAGGPHNGTLIRSNRAGDFVVHNCGVLNNKSTAFMFYFNNNQPYQPHQAASYDHQSGFSHLDDCYSENFGGEYGGAFWGFHDTLADSSMAVTGCRFDQDPHAISGGTEWSGMFRENGHHKVHIQCSEIFTKEDANTPFKLCTTPFANDIPHVINVHGIVTEGGDTSVYVLQNVQQSYSQSFDVNAVIDGAVLVSDYATADWVSTLATGVTVRNVLGILPNVRPLSAHGLGSNMNDEESASDPRVTYTTRLFEAAIQVFMRDNPPAQVLDQPIRVYNNTFVVARPNSDNRSTSSQGTTPYKFHRLNPASATPTNVVLANNIWHGEWAGLTNPPDHFKPLATDLVMNTQNIGWKGWVSKTLNSTMATPPDAIKSYRPMITSPALGAALTEPTAYDDITGRIRPAFPSIGAWEADA